MVELYFSSAASNLLYTLLFVLFFNPRLITETQFLHSLHFVMYIYGASRQCESSPFFRTQDLSRAATGSSVA